MGSRSIGYANGKSQLSSSFIIWHDTQVMHRIRKLVVRMSNWKGGVDRQTEGTRIDAASDDDIGHPLRSHPSPPLV